jgi:hypothetical protein
MLLKPLLTKDCPKKVRGVIEKIREMGAPWSIGTIKNTENGYTLEYRYLRAVLFRPK